MSSNNYIRKIDELGRIVIPKEIRNKLKIQDNESILISINDNNINISKYSYLNNYKRFIEELCNQITEIYKVQIQINDLERIVYSNVITGAEYKYIEDIIKDSTKVGSIIIYSNTNEDFKKLTKLISKIINIFIMTY